MEIRNFLPWVNLGNGTAQLQLECLEYLMAIVPPDKQIIALEIGSAYGGGVEMMAKVLGGRGKVYGYDTFEGHPSDLSDDPNSNEATCMELWYKAPYFGRGKKLTYEYQRKVLDEQGLDNAILVKGRVNEHSFDDIPYAHLVMLDLDLVKPTKVAYYAIKDKVVPGGFLFCHDAVPNEHLPLLHHFIYKEVVPDPMWTVEGEYPLKLVLTVLRRKT